MNYGKTIFAQLMDFLPAPEFRHCVERYQGHYKIKSFTCWDQFLCMAFAQLTYRESLRDIQACLRGSQQKLYHLGFRGKVSRNTLAHANQVRDWQLFVSTKDPQGSLLVLTHEAAVSLHIRTEDGGQLTLKIFRSHGVISLRFRREGRRQYFSDILTMEYYKSLQGDKKIPWSFDGHLPENPSPLHKFLPQRLEGEV